MSVSTDEGDLQQLLHALGMDRLPMSTGTRAVIHRAVHRVRGVRQVQLVEGVGRVSVYVVLAVPWWRPLRRRGTLREVARAARAAVAACIGLQVYEARPVAVVGVRS